MNTCPDCGVNYEREFDAEETFEYVWVPRCTCLEDNHLMDDLIWEHSD